MGVRKGCQELSRIGRAPRCPRLLLVQSDRCAPMAQGWRDALRGGFSPGWERRYPVIDAPETDIATLATGHPSAFPLLAPMVRQSEGSIFAVREASAKLVAKLVAAESSVRVGPAAAIGLGGAIRAIHSGHIRSGDVVVLNVGEGMRRSPSFMRSLVGQAEAVRTVSDCKPLDRKEYARAIWQAVEEEFSVEPGADQW